MNGSRLLALLVVLLLILSLSACSSDEPEATQSTTQEAPLVTEPTAEVGENGELIYEGANAKCLFENESCSFTLMKAEIDSLSDYCWDVTLVNSTGTPQIFTIDEVYVNDIRFDPNWAVKVEAGKTVDESIIWTAPEMDARKITQITRVDFVLRVYADNGREYANVALTSYPSGKSAYIPRERDPQTTDVVLINNEAYTVIITGDDPDNRWGYALELYLQNKSGRNVEFTIENVLVSGEEIDPQWRYAVAAGKQATSEIIWFDHELEELEDITGITFELVICDDSGNVLTRESFVYVP